MRVWGVTVLARAQQAGLGARPMALPVLRQHGHVRLGHAILSALSLCCPHSLRVSPSFKDRISDPCIPG